MLRKKWLFLMDFKGHSLNLVLVSYWIRADLVHLHIMIVKRKHI